MVKKVLPTIAALGIAAVAVTAASELGASAPSATFASATDANAVRVSAIRLASVDQVLMDDSCYGEMQGSYYCYSKGGADSSPSSEYTPVKPAFGYSDLPQCSGSSSAIVGALSGDGCS